MSGDHPVLVIDNGGYTMKALYLHNPTNTVSHPPRQAVVPNCVGAAAFAGRGIVGEQLFKLPHFHGFMVRRPVDRGFVVDAALQSYIWEYVLQVFAIADESDVELLLTVPFAAPKPVVEVLHYLVAQRFKFRAVTLVSSTFLALVAAASIPLLHGIMSASDNGGNNNSNNDETNDERNKNRADILCGDGGGNNNNNNNNSGCGCGMVVDFGFSATTVVPYVDFLPIRDAVVRVDVGGKLLSNRLKELVSFTQVNMTEDGWLVNHIMERCCYVALEPLAMLRETQRLKRRRGSTNTNTNSSSSSSSGIGRKHITELRYYLPTVPPLMPLGCREEELHDVLKGEAVAPDKHNLQYLVFSHEAFLIPELLFHPVDVGIHQMGVVEAILKGTTRSSLLRDAPALHQALCRRIVAFGGIAKFRQMRERLSNELQAELIKQIPLDISTAATATNIPVLQPLAQRRYMNSINIEEHNTVALYSLHDTELQPLYGALSLLTQPSQKHLLQLVSTRSHVDLSGLRSQKQGIQRTQSSTMHKIQKALQDALNNLL